MQRPKGDLDALAIPKDQSEVPLAAPVGQGNKAYAHTLSLRLTAEQYRRLRRYVAATEDRTGARTTHQRIFEDALAEYLDKRGG